MSETYTGKQVVLDALETEGVDCLFGNPGTTELPLIDGLVDHPGLRYILCLHEAIAVTMADAYAHATGGVGVVNLHVGPGLGNGLGSVYNAFRRNTPLIVTAGQQDRRMRLRDPLLGHDLVAMAAPLTKWSVEAATADELADIMHRAFKTAREAPAGPVFVSLPFNVMEQTTGRGALRPSVLHSRVPPDPAGVAAAADLLAAAAAPVIICGDDVAHSGAVDTLVTLAERLGAEVLGEVLPARVNFPNRHPQWSERMAGDQRGIRERLGDADAVLLVGCKVFEEVWHVDGHPFPDGAPVIQIDAAPENLARNYRVDCGLIADPAAALAALDAAVAQRQSQTSRTAAAARREALAARKASEHEAQAARAGRDHGNRPMSTARLMAEVERGLPARTAIAGEPITAGGDLQRTLDLRDPSDYLASRGGGIGQGLPSAIALKLACPDRPVLCISGDGSALYTIQALWTAAHHDIPVVFLIINNGTYRILKLNMNRYRSVSGIDHARGFPHLDLSDPPIDFVSVARGFGLEARRIADPDELAPALRAGFDGGAPCLLEVVVDGPVPVPGKGP